VEPCDDGLEVADYAAAIDFAVSGVVRMLEVLGEDGRVRERLEPRVHEARFAQVDEPAARALLFLPLAELRKPLTDRWRRGELITRLEGRGGGSSGGHRGRNASAGIVVAWRRAVCRVPSLCHV